MTIKDTLKKEEDQNEISEIEGRFLEQELLMEGGVDEDFAFYSAFIKD